MSVDGMNVDGIDVDGEYEHWLGRLESTYDAVTYTCTYRLGDSELAREVGFRVLVAMIAKPQVFRHYGLPYSGRIGRLAEPLIATARQGGLAAGPSRQWVDLLEQLRHVPPEVKDVAVAAWVLGHKRDALGAALGCDADSAGRRRDEALAWVHSLVQVQQQLSKTDQEDQSRV